MTSSPGFPARFSPAWTGFTGAAALPRYNKFQGVRLTRSVWSAAEDASIFKAGVFGSVVTFPEQSLLKITKISGPGLSAP